MPKDYYIKQLIDYFDHKESFSKDELFAFYLQREPFLKEGTLAWRIYDLKKKNIIKSVKKSHYTLIYKPTYKPDLDKSLLKISHILQSNQYYNYYNIWKTSWLNEFIELQATSFIVILEVDKESIETVFYKMKDNFSNVFLKPEEKLIEQYVSEAKESIIIKPMVSRAPTQNIQKVTVPTIEKILVDLFSDEKIYYAYQGNSLLKIYETALEKYTINYSKLFGYAKRRNREDAIKEFLLANLNHKIKDLIE